MANRSAPRDGYDFGNKRQYRRAVWATFRKSLFWRPGARAVLLPSCEGDEIDVAKANGFAEKNLVIVDRNAAIVASLKRRYPHVTTCGVALDRAAERLAPVDFANLDLCSPWSRPLHDTLKAVAESALVPFGMIAVTLLRGREREGANEALRQFETPDRARVACIAGTLMSTAFYGPRALPYPGNLVSVVREEIYRSAAGHQTMMWVAFDVHAQPCACLGCAQAAFLTAAWSVDEWLAQVGEAFGEDPDDILQEGRRRQRQLYAHCPCCRSEVTPYKRHLLTLRDQTRVSSRGFPVFPADLTERGVWSGAA